MNRKVVVIRDMSAGNDSVGEMWQETKIFNSDQPISDILEWVMDESDTYTRKRITITVPYSE
jgi:hypothetical protein